MFYAYVWIPQYVCDLLGALTHDRAWQREPCLKSHCSVSLCKFTDSDGLTNHVRLVAILVFLFVGVLALVLHILVLVGIPVFDVALLRLQGICHGSIDLFSLDSASILTECLRWTTGALQPSLIIHYLSVLDVIFGFPARAGHTDSDLAVRLA